MPTLRGSITFKFFVAMSVVATLVIVCVGIVIATNMRTGFARYLAQTELAQFDRLHDELVLRHRQGDPGWAILKGDRRSWNIFVRAAMPPSRNALRPQRALPPPRTRNNRPPPRRIDPMGFGGRLVLLDADRNLIAGAQGKNSVFVSRPVRLTLPNGEEKTLGWLGLTAAAGPMSQGDALFLSDQAKALLATSLVAFCLCGLAAYVLSRQFLKPIHQLAQAGERLSTGDYSIRIEESRTDELGALIDQFNRLAENLQEKDRIERKWVSDTSHELKTPLAVLRAQIEAIQDGVHLADTARLKELHASTMRLTRLVADLNSLANMREGQLSTTIENENVSDIVAARVDNALEHSAGAELSIRTNIEPGLQLDCDRLRIGQMLDNLIENATRYTTLPGLVCITARSTNDGFEIIVEDSPPCPPEPARKKLFDRFYREEMSRNRKHGGSGLGLSICREIVRIHGGPIALSPSQLGGLKARLYFPRTRMIHE